MSPCSLTENPIVFHNFSYAQVLHNVSWPLKYSYISIQWAALGELFLQGSRVRMQHTVLTVQGVSGVKWARVSFCYGKSGWSWEKGWHKKEFHIVKLPIFTPNIHRNQKSVNFNFAAYLTLLTELWSLDGHIDICKRSHWVMDIFPPNFSPKLSLWTRGISAECHPHNGLTPPALVTMHPSEYSNFARIPPY